MNQLNQILKIVLIQIKPSNQEIFLVNKIVENLIYLIKKRANELNLNYTKIEPQGSSGIKQTQLINDYDIDLFIGLKYESYMSRHLKNKDFKKETRKQFLELCEEWILKALTDERFKNPNISYIDHPYVNVDYIIDDFKINIDIVLYFDLDLAYIKKNGPITSVDRTAWHGRFIRDNLTIKQKDDVRLLKQFFKSSFCYGDKECLGNCGFIGYHAELLIFHFKTIQNALNNFDNLVKNPLDFHNRDLTNLKSSHPFKKDYIIITDPVDMKRNVASAISEVSFRYCSKKIKDFLQKPSIEFFEVRKIPEIELTNFNDALLSKIYIVELKNNNQNIHYTSIRNNLYSIGEKIKNSRREEYSADDRFGNIIFEVYFEDELGEYNLSIYCEKPVISQTYLRKGPPITRVEHANKFKKRNPKCFEKDGYLYSESKRKYSKFQNFLKYFIYDNIPENFEIINISKSFDTKTSSGKKAIYVLKNMILPLKL